MTCIKRQPVRVTVVLTILAIAGLLFSSGSPLRTGRFREWVIEKGGLGSLGSIESSPHGSVVAGGVPENFIKDAHKLPDADSFLPHFKAVMQMKKVTMDDAKSGCTWPFTNALYFTYDGTDVDWRERDKTDLELDRRRREWQDFIENRLLPYEGYKDRFEGRGIVIVAGNEKSLKRVMVILRALSKLGSRLPIELHYWRNEMSDESRENMSSLWRPNEIYFNDLAAPSNIAKTDINSFSINYQLKTAAMMNSRFAEPLLLDSDNIPVLDPEVLYRSSTYQEYGTLFWPDIARTRPNNPMWSITNTPCRMDEYEQESGQLIVDKRRFFYHLQLADWFNNAHKDHYYNEFLLGDKDLFRFAWHALKTPYGAPTRWTTSVGTLSSDGFYCGHSFAQHHPDQDDGRVAFLHGGLLKSLRKPVIKWQRESRGGVFQVYKRHEYDQDHSVGVNVSIKWDDARYLPNRPADMEAAFCTDFYQVPAKPLDDIVPGFEKTFEEIGGYWMLDQ